MEGILFPSKGGDGHSNFDINPCITYSMLENRSWQTVSTH